MKLVEYSKPRCDCELPGPYHTGVPGVLAVMDGDRIARDAIVERCDLCRRFDSDVSARLRLIELNLAVPTSAERAFTVDCLAVVRVRFPGVLATGPEEAVQRTLDRFSWDTHLRQAEFVDRFIGFEVDGDDLADKHQFDSAQFEVNNSRG